MASRPLFSGHDPRAVPGRTTVPTAEFGGAGGASNPFTGLFSGGGAKTAMQVLGSAMMGFGGQGGQAIQAIQQDQQQQAAQGHEAKLQAAAKKFVEDAGRVGARKAGLDLFRTDPDAAFELQPLIKQMAELEQEPAVTAPEMRKFREGTEEVSQEFDPVTGQWNEVGRGAAFAPPAQTNVTVGAPVTELERDKQLGRQQGDRMAALSVERQARKKRSAVVGMMSSMIKDGRVQTGGGSRMAIRANELLGIDLGEDIDDLQAFDQLANTLILDLKAQQKGTQTDRDQSVIAATVPGINKSVEANKLAIEIITALDARLEAEAQKEYELIENGLSPFAAENAVRDHFGERPVFSDDMVARAGRLGGGTAQAAVPEQAGPKAPLTTKQLQDMSIEELEAYYAD